LKNFYQLEDTTFAKLVSLINETWKSAENRPTIRKVNKTMGGIWQNEIPIANRSEEVDDKSEVPN